MTQNIPAPELQKLPKIARETISAAIKKTSYSGPKLLPEFDQSQGVFVTIQTHEGELRGCIGHIGAMCRSLTEEVQQCARAAAFEDPRFPPLNASELDSVRIEISLLSPLEPVASTQDLDCKKYGVVVSSGFRRGLLLPDLEGVNSVASQLDIARQKARISPKESIEIHRFTIKKVQE
jgi:AmmeMemoRadiSam system protein A